jgi:NADH-quinone oxidoreductase subunit A
LGAPEGPVGYATETGKEDDVLDPYMPIAVLFALAAAFAVFSVVVGSFIGPRRYNTAKMAAYESGIEPEPLEGGRRFPVKFYLTAMLFIVFDIEIIFLYPWAVLFGQETNTEGATSVVFLLLEMGLFLGTVFVAYAYVWRRGGLEWD